MADIELNDLLITSLDTITGYDLTGGLKFIMDELQNATVSNTEDSTSLTGKQGRLLGQLKTNKAASVTATNGTIVLGLMESQLGKKGTHESSQSVRKIEYLTVSSNEATTTYVATGTAGNEIGEVIVRNANGTIKERLTQASTAASGKFAYSTSTRKLTFNSGDLADGTSIIVSYKHSVEADVLVNDAETNSETVELFIDGLAEDKCKVVYHFQIHAPMASLTGNFDLAMGDSQTVHNLEANFLASNCGTNTKFYDLTVFTDTVAS